jgi:hypothetical protein
MTSVLEIEHIATAAIGRGGDGYSLVILQLNNIIGSAEDTVRLNPLDILTNISAFSNSTHCGTHVIYGMRTPQCLNHHPQPHSRSTKEPAPRR